MRESECPRGRARGHRFGRDIIVLMFSLWHLILVAAWGSADVPVATSQALPASDHAPLRATTDASWFRSTYVDVKDTLPRLRVERAWVHHMDATWAYAHHPYLTRYKGTWYAMWSSSRRDEDAGGQRVAFATSPDLRTWSPSRALAEPGMGKDGKEAVLTPAGFLEHGGTLAAFYSRYEHDMTGTRMFVVRTQDGETWSAPEDIGVPSCPNAGPRPIAGGRLILAGNTTFPYTDDPSGLTGWRTAALHPWNLTNPEDNPRTFWDVQKVAGWPVGLCSSAFFETRDGTVRMLLRARGEQGWRLWLSDSTDLGETYSPPAPTKFLDNDASFQFGTLPDGLAGDARVWYVGYPDPARGWARSRLVLSTSSDDKVFGRHWLIADEPYDIQQHGQYKLGEYSYPHVTVIDGMMYILVSREKEAIEVIWLDLAQLNTLPGAATDPAESADAPATNSR